MKQEIKIGNVYTGTGSVGMSKDRQITGELTEYNAQYDMAILKDNKGQVHEVIYNSLELVGLHTGNIDRWENNSSIDYKKYLNNFSLVIPMIRKAALTKTNNITTEK